MEWTQGFKPPEAPEPMEPPGVLWPLRAVFFNATVAICRAFNVFTRSSVHNREGMRAAVEGREPGRPLLTVCNHVSTVDDPFVISVVAPFRSMMRQETARWGWCAQEICFGHGPVLSRLFASGQLAPVSRGAGLDQPAVRWALEHMDRGRWFHVFPEGMCAGDPARPLGALRWGVGRLAADCAHPDPLIVPFHHVGMHRVLPLVGGGGRLPAAGQRVTVVVGEPVSVRDLVERHERLVRNNPGWGDPWPPHREDLYESITGRVEEAMLRTAEEAGRLHGTDD